MARQKATLKLTVYLASYKSEEDAVIRYLKGLPVSEELGDVVMALIKDGLEYRKCKNLENVECSLTERSQNELIDRLMRALNGKVVEQGINDITQITSLEDKLLKESVELEPLEEFEGLEEVKSAVVGSF